MQSNSLNHCKRNCFASPFFLNFIALASQTQAEDESKAEPNILVGSGLPLGMELLISLA